MSAMRIGVLVCLLLAMVPLASAHEEPPGPTRPGTVTGRVIEHEPSGLGMSGVTLRLDANGTPMATTVTDSAGNYTLTAPGNHHAIYGLNVEFPGWECDGHGHGLVTILPDSVTRLLDFIMWPVGYFDSTTYREFMSANSITLHPRPRPSTAPVQHRDSTLLTVYRNYLSRARKDVLRSNVSPPWDSNSPGGRPDVKEHGVYLFIEKERCRLMEILMHPTTGMRLWDVDSIKLGSLTKGGFIQRSPDSLREDNWWWGLCLKVYLRPNGWVFIDSWGGLKDY